MLRDDYIALYGEKQFKARYYKTGSVTVTFNISEMPEHFQDGHLDEWFGGNLSYYSHGVPDDIEVTDCSVEFPRPIKKFNDLCCTLDLGYPSSYFSVSIPWAIGESTKDITSKPSSRYYKTIAQIIMSGRGTGVQGRVTKQSSADHSGVIIRFASSKSYAQDAAGHGNCTKFTVRVKYRYDPAKDYQASGVTFKTYSATACDTSWSSNPASYPDINCILATIVPASVNEEALYDHHIYHNILWYTTDAGRQNHLFWYDRNGNIKWSDDPQRIVYVDGSSELQLKYPIPLEWCYGWPNATVGWGYFTMDTWYKYDKHPSDDEAPEFCLGALDKPKSFTVQTPDSVRPSITSTHFEVLPSDLPWTSQVNQLSSTWVNSGYYVQHYCTLNITVQGAGSYGSTIESYTLVEDTYRTIKRTLRDGHNLASVQNIPISGTIAFTVYAKDSRGRYSEVKYIPMPGYNCEKLPLHNEDGSTVVVNNVIQTYDALKIMPYSMAVFDYTRSSRINDQGDIAENGKYVAAEASTIHTMLVEHTPGNDLNSVVTKFQFTRDGQNNWLPTSSSAISPTLLEGQTKQFIHSSLQTYPAYKYLVKFTTQDAMCRYLLQEAIAYNRTISSSYQEDATWDSRFYDTSKLKHERIESLGSGTPTVFLKRDGLGIGIGMEPETNLNYRCLEIAESWELRHGRDPGKNGASDVIYYIPDVVFTTSTDPLPPKRRKGRIWLKEIG